MITSTVVANKDPNRQRHVQVEVTGDIESVWFQVQSPQENFEDLHSALA